MNGTFFLLRAIEVGVADDAVLRGNDAGDERGVVRPGDGRERTDDAVGASSFGGQATQGRHVGRGIVEVESAQAVDADENDAAILARLGTTGRRSRGKRRRRHGKQRKQVERRDA